MNHCPILLQDTCCFDIQHVEAVLMSVYYLHILEVLFVLTQLYISLVLIIVIIMVIFKCYFSREHIALSIRKKTGVNMELGKKQQNKCTENDAK